MSTFDNSLNNQKLDLVSKDSNALPKLTLRLDLFSKTLKMDSVDIFMLRRTIRLWRGRNLCVHQTTLPTWKRKYWKWILLIFVHEREQIPNGSFTNWQIWQFLQLYSNMYPWVVKILFCLNRSWKIKMWIALLTNRTRKKPYKDNLCLFRTLALHLHGNERLEEETSKIFNNFLNKCGEADPSKFQGVHMTDIPKVEKILLYIF